MWFLSLILNIQTNYVILSRLISTKEIDNNKQGSELELIALDNNLENKIDKITNSLSRQYFNTILKKFLESAKKNDIDGFIIPDLNEAWS